MYSSCLKTPGMSSFMANKVNNYARMSKFSINLALLFSAEALSLTSWGAYDLPDDALKAPREYLPISYIINVFSISNLSD